MRKHSKDRQIQGEKKESGVQFTKLAGGSHEYPGGGHRFLAPFNPQCLGRLEATTVGASYAKGAILFAEGQAARGVYVILEGRTKLSIGSANGKSLILGFFGPGSVLGLVGTIAGLPYEATVEIVRPTRATFVPRDDLLRRMRGNAKDAFYAAELASETSYFILSKMKAIALSQSTQEKLAQFLLGLPPVGESSKRLVRAELDLRQEDIAQMIGASRETVTRLFSRLKKRHILDWKRSTLDIRDRAALEKLAESSGADANRALDPASQDRADRYGGDAIPRKRKT